MPASWRSGRTAPYGSDSATAMRIEGRRAPDHETQELEDLRARVAALEEGHAQLAELQDRVEFAERLHSREHQPRPGLPG